MAPQVSRLAICFAVLIAGFFAVRSQVVPENFGRDGWHRIEAPAKLASRDIKHAGREACAQCHDDKVKSTPHIKAGLACETCHGPAQAHVQDFDKFKPFRPSARSFCTRCHEALVGRRSDFPTIDPKTHNPSQRCIECHTIHPQEATK